MYKGFTGKIEKNGSGRYISYGTLSNEVSNNGMYQYTVSELPINMWTDKFKEMCDQYRESN